MALFLAVNAALVVVLSGSAARAVPAPTWVHVGGTGSYGCALHKSGRVGCWGDAFVEGRLGNPTTKTAFRSGTRAGLGRDALMWVDGIEHATRLSVSKNGACVVDKGEAQCWGWHQSDRIGLGPAVDVAAASDVVCVVRPQGTLHCGKAGHPFGTPNPQLIARAEADYAWCQRRTPQAGVCKRPPAPRNQIVPGIDDAMEVSLRYLVPCVARKSGVTTCVLLETDGRLNRKAPFAAPVGDVEGIRNDGEAFCAIERKSRRPTCWGRIAAAEPASFDNAIVINVPGPAHSVGIAQGGACVVLEDGTLYCWGHNAPPQVRHRGSEVKAVALAAPATATSGACVALNDGRIRCTDVRRFVARRVPGLIDVVDIDGGCETFCAVDKVGKVFCWGGRSTRSGGATPAAIDAPAGTQQVRLSTQCRAVDVCVRTTRDEVWCRGPRDDAFTRRASKTTAFGLGDSHLCVVAKGRVRCEWLDDSVTDEAPKTPALGGVRALAHDNDDVVCAQTKSGARCLDRFHHATSWGRAVSVRSPRALAVGFKQLFVVDGSGRTFEWAMVDRNVDRGSKKRVLREHNVTGLWSRYGDSCARTKRAALLCTHMPSNERVFDWSELELDAIDDVAMGQDATCVLRRGEVWCWGDGAAGQLGDGTAPPAFVDIPIAPLPQPSNAEQQPT